MDALPRLQDTHFQKAEKVLIVEVDHPFKHVLYPWNTKCPYLLFPGVGLRVYTTLWPNTKASLYVAPAYLLFFSCKVLFWSQLISTGKPWIQHFQSAEFTWGTFLVLWNRAVLALMFPFSTKAVVRSGGKMCEPKPALPVHPISCLSWATIMAPLWTPTAAVA